MGSLEGAERKKDCSCRFRTHPWPFRFPAGYAPGWGVKMLAFRMLIIRDQQMQAFRRERLEGFKREAFAWLQRPRPTPAPFAHLSAKELRALVDEGTAAAFDHGFLARSHVLAFIECVCLHGSKFYRREPWARAVLREDALSAEIKLARLRAGDPGRAG